MKAKHVFLTLGLSLTMALGVGVAVSAHHKPVKEAKAVSNVALYFSNNTGESGDWYFYTWKNADPGNPAAAWPGEQMAYTSDHLYEIPMTSWNNATYDRFIINNGDGGTWQTKDMEKGWFTDVSGDLFYYVEDSGKSLGVTTRHGYKYSVDGGANYTNMVYNGPFEVMSPSNEDLQVNDTILFKEDNASYSVSPKDDDRLTNVYLDSGTLTVGKPYNGVLYLDIANAKLWAGQFSGYYFAGSNTSWNVKKALTASKEGDSNVYYVENVVLAANAEIKCIYAHDDSNVVDYFDANEGQVITTTDVEYSISDPDNNLVVTNAGTYNIYYNVDSGYYSIEDCNPTTHTYTVFVNGNSEPLEINAGTEYMTGELDLESGMSVSVLKDGSPDGTFHFKAIGNNNISSSNEVLVDADNVRIYVDLALKTVFVDGIPAYAGSTVNKYYMWQNGVLVTMTHTSEYDEFDQWCTDSQYFESSETIRFIDISPDSAIPSVFDIATVNPGGLGDKFAVSAGKIICITPCSCNVYLKLKYEHDEIYFGEVEQYIADAIDFAKGFNTAIGAICEEIEDHNNRKSEMEAEWLVQAGLYSDLTAESKGYLAGGSSSPNEHVRNFDAKYVRVYETKKIGLGWNLDDFLGKGLTSNHIGVNVNRVVNNTAIIVIISVTTILVSAGVTFYFLRKKKYSK